MRILHYSLGFPPYRSGGLTKFCVDLMRQQAANGHQLALLWPGQMGVVNRKLLIKDRGNVTFHNQWIRSFEVINPLPIPFDEGISSFELFMEEADKDIYIDFLKKYSPRVIHVHTLMGLHKAFLQAAKEMNIRLVFTAHDFFPICPKVTLFRNGNICEFAESCQKCETCNITALSMTKIKILQSPFYRMLKDFPLVKKMRKQHRDGFLSEKVSEKDIMSVGDASDFKRLRGYYESMLRLMDMVHYNSTVTKAVYEKFFAPFSNQVIGISHGDIEDHRKIKDFFHKPLRIRYLGPMGGAKGFFYLKAALDQLWNERNDFCLDVHFILPETSPYIRSHRRYNYIELEEIFDNTDILVAPSVWYETFGYTVLEALSYGVPVIITENVGAKDILVDGAGIVIADVKSNELFEAINGLTAYKLAKMNKVIIEKQKILTLEEMAENIEKLCYNVNFHNN